MSIFDSRQSVFIRVQSGALAIPRSHRWSRRQFYSSRVLYIFLEIYGICEWVIYQVCASQPVLCVKARYCCTLFWRYQRYVRGLPDVRKSTSL